MTEPTRWKFYDPTLLALYPLGYGVHQARPRVLLNGAVAGLLIELAAFAMPCVNGARI